ncbi:unnamed protein product [Diabrotica balteata]|uniref:RING-type E3 ubiquitin transferase n=1 Tax=Diabrotica balteata TaxID=107213 RepID=A0A9N9XCQ5_DIABA|nr:unnamed protein product [Diabrotica balteata]
MAEAAVEDRPPQKFYCHMCNVQFQNASANFTCPHCSDGFIEELQETSEDNEEMIDVEDWVHEDMMDNLMSQMPLNVVEERRPRTRSDGAQPWRRYLNRSRTLRPRSEKFIITTLTRIASSNLRQNVSFENILQDFIVNLGVGVNFGTAANMQLFLGNPGDYAWGREGLDAIVTQLLNQMDTTANTPYNVLRSLFNSQSSNSSSNSSNSSSSSFESSGARTRSRSHSDSTM